VTDISIGLAIVAGALSFLSPCVLALVPVYVAFLGEAATVGGPSAERSTGSVVPQALLFVAGFSVVFVVVGTSIGLIGAPLFRIPEVRQAAGIAMVALGVVTTGAFGPVFDRIAIGLDPRALPTSRSVRALALGAFVAVGWTPCIGPVLGAILTMGASSGSAPVVALLLSAYSFGLAVPFVAAALAFPRLRPLVEVVRRHHRAVHVVSGLLIVAIGVLIYINAFARMAGLFTWVL